MKKRVNIYISKELHLELRKIALDEGLTFSALLELIGKQYIKEKES